MSVAEKIQEKLSRALKCEKLEVQDQSHLHEGHAGHRKGGESHFKVTIVSKDFEGKTRVERHKMIYALLKDELLEQIHALALDLKTPEK